MTNLSRKICLMGDYGVGKTSLISRFVDGQFSDQYLTTVGVKISRKLITVNDDVEVHLIIWDLEGSTKFQSVLTTYLQGAHGAIIVGDVTRPDTIGHFLEHQTHFHSCNPGKPIVGALNKIDLITAPVTMPVMDFKLFQTSAKLGQAVNEMFAELSIQLAAISL